MSIVQVLGKYMMIGYLDPCGYKFKCTISGMDETGKRAEASSNGFRHD